jgi:hypothetical protein
MEIWVIMSVAEGGKSSWTGIVLGRMAHRGSPQLSSSRSLSYFWLSFLPLKRRSLGHISLHYQMDFEQFEGVA